MLQSTHVIEDAPDTPNVYLQTVLFPLLHLWSPILRGRVIPCVCPLSSPVYDVVFFVLVFLLIRCQVVPDPDAFHMILDVVFVLKIF